MPELSRAAAQRLSSDRPVRASRWKPTLWTFRWDGRVLAVKDVRSATPLFRYTLGRYSLAREARCYGRLDGLDFVPSFVGRLDHDAIVLEWIGEAASLRIKERPQDLPGDFFDRLDDCVARLHRRGIVHLDLRHRTNILATAKGEPRLLDFELATELGRFVWLLAWVDRSAVTKFRLRYFPHQLTPRQASRYRRLRSLSALWRTLRTWPPEPLRRRSKYRRRRSP